MKSKFILASLCLATVGLLSGCGSEGTAKTAAEVVEKYNAAFEEPNYHMNMEMYFSMSAEADGESMDMPIKIFVDADVYGEDAHGNLLTKASWMGMDMSSESEVYVVSDKNSFTTYTYDDEEDYWLVNEDSSQVGFVSFAELNSKYFKNSEFVYDRKSGIYTVTQTFEDFMKSDSNEEMVNSMFGDSSYFMSFDIDDMYDSWADSSVVYVFDKGYNLVSVTLEDYSYKTKLKEEGTTVKVETEMGVSVEFSEQGKVRPSDVSVPKSVVRDAVPFIELNGTGHGEFTDSGFLIEGSFGYDDTSDFEEGEFGEMEPSEEVEFSEAVEASGEETSLGLSEEATTSTSFNSDSKLGFYNGYELTGQGDSWDKIFAADGWVFDNEDGLYSFMSCKNPKYKDADLYVYSLSGRDVTSSEILSKGMYGYTIDAYYADDKPEMSWSGLTFGATLDDIEEVYGTPDYTYEGSMYTTYTYKFQDGVELEFTVYPKEGVQEVELYVYNG